MKHNIGFIGARGNMGRAMTGRLADAGYNVVGYDVKNEPGVNPKVTMAGNIQELSDRVQDPRAFFLMVSHDNIDPAIQELKPHLRREDVVINGGNTYFEDEIRRAVLLGQLGIAYLDAGTSGGPYADGWNFIVGGRKDAFERTEEVFNILANGGGVLYVGDSGLGMLVKEAHNALEYVIMQGTAEIAQFLDTHLKQYGAKVTVADVFENWNRGALVQSRLLGIAAKALRDPEFERTSTVVGSAGRWIEDVLRLASERNIPMPLVYLALSARGYSRGEGDIQYRLLADMRKRFGGHVPPEKEK